MEKLRNITFRQLETFLELSRLSSFGATAARLGIGQSAVSRNVKQLEDELGVILISRHSKGGILTKDGIRLSTTPATFFEAVQRLADLDRAPDQNGSFTIGMPPTLSGILMPSIFKSVTQHLPNIELRFLEAPASELEQAIIAGRINLCLLYEPPKTDVITNIPVIEESVVVIAPPSWEWPTSRQFVTVRDLGGLPVVLMQSGHSDRRILDKAERKVGVQIKPLLETSNPSTLKALVNSGVGLSVASAFGVMKEVAAGSLQSWPLGRPGVKIRLFISTFTDDVSSTKFGDLREIVTQIILAATRNDPFITPSRSNGILLAL